jgi:hypothetical protein
MTMAAREAFEKGTAAFNAHDLDGFAWEPRRVQWASRWAREVQQRRLVN